MYTLEDVYKTFPSGCTEDYKILRAFEMGKQTSEKQIAELEKENERLTDELKALRESIKDYGAGCYENGLRNGKRKLEAQIEKMKCCENCGWYYLQQHWRESKEIDESRMFHCGTCGNKRNWKLREIKEK